MDHQIQLKYNALTRYLGPFNRVGVACSGGIDSTFLAYVCVEVLGAENVIILFGDSQLQTQTLRRTIEERLTRELGAGVHIQKIPVDPFSQAAFVRNTKERCYICKTHVYRQFLDHLKGLGIEALLDGTNCDDLQEDRPGLKALKELKVFTPLVEAGFHKHEIRLAAAHVGISYADLPSNSCLATRIQPQHPIEVELMRSIEEMESFLHARGYQGCRVRPQGGTVAVEVLTKDLERFVSTSERTEIIEYFKIHGHDVVVLDLKGRTI